MNDPYQQTRSFMQVRMPCSLSKWKKYENEIFCDGKYLRPPSLHHRMSGCGSLHMCSLYLHFSLIHSNSRSSSFRPAAFPPCPGRVQFPVAPTQPAALLGLQSETGVSAASIPRRHPKADVATHRHTIVPQYVVTFHHATPLSASAVESFYSVA
jgi:hypothetical protein